MAFGIKLPGFVKKFYTSAEDELRKKEEQARRFVQHPSLPKPKQLLDAGAFLGSTVLPAMGNVLPPVLAYSAYRTFAPDPLKRKVEEGLSWAGPKAMEGLDEYTKRAIHPQLASIKRESMRGGEALMKLESEVAVRAGLVSRERHEQLWKNWDEKVEEQGLHGPPINPVKAYLGDKETNEEVKKVIGGMPLVERIVLELVLDPANLLPVVGFGPDMAAMFKAARAGMGTKAGRSALEAIVSNQNFREQAVRLGRETMTSHIRPVAPDIDLLRREPLISPRPDISDWDEVVREGVTSLERRAGGVTASATVHPTYVETHLIGTSSEGTVSAFRAMGRLALYHNLPIRTTVVNEKLAERILPRLGGRQIGEGVPETMLGYRETMARVRGVPIEEIPAVKSYPVYEVTPEGVREAMKKFSPSELRTYGLEALPEPFDFTEAVKVAASDAQAPHMQQLARREDELKKLFAAFPNHENSATWRDEIEGIAAKRVELRGEVYETVELLTRAPQVIPEGSVTPRISTLEELEQWAFGNPGRVERAVTEIGKVPVARELITGIQPIRNHARDTIARLHDSYLRQIENAESINTWADNAFSGLGGNPFKLGKNTIEKTTGISLYDIGTEWNTGRKFKNFPQFGKQHDDYMNLFQKVRKDALLDAEKLGVKIPDAWFEIDDMLRKVIGKDGKELTDILEAGGRGGKPGSFKARLWEQATEGIAHNVNYADPRVALIDGVRAIRRYAVLQNYRRTLATKGVLVSAFVDRSIKNTRLLASQNYTWTRRVQNYVGQSIRGRPAKPVLKDTMQQNVPEELRKIANEVSLINSKYKGKIRAEHVRPIRDRIDALTGRAKEAQTAARTAVKRAGEEIKAHTKLPGRYFERGGEQMPEAVRVGMLPGDVLMPNRMFTQDQLKSILKYHKDVPFKGVVGLAEFSDVLRLPTLVDVGWSGIQNVMALGFDMFNLSTGKPTNLWGRSAYSGLRGFFQPEKFGAYMDREFAKHPDLAASWIQHGRVMANHSSHAEETLGAVYRGGLFERIENLIPGYRRVRLGSRFGDAMAAGMDAAMWKWWKAIAPLAKGEPDKLDELGSIIRACIGRSSARGNGIKATQRALERALVLWGPAYTRGSVALLAKAAIEPASFGGRQVLKSLIGLTEVTTIIGGFLMMAKQLEKNGGNVDKLSWNDLGKDMQDYWNVTNPRTFQTVRIGNNNFGLGGAVRSNLAVIGRLVYAAQEKPESLSPLDLSGSQFPFVNWDNPLIRAYRAKTSPLTGHVWSIISGETYMGTQLDSPEQYLLQASGDMAPFAIQSYLQAEGGVTDKLAAGAAEFMGTRSYPVRPYDLYKEEAERTLGEAWEDLDGTPQLSFARDDKEANPELYQRWQNYQEDLRSKNDDIQAARDRAEIEKDKSYDEMGTLAQGIQWGSPGGGTWYKEQRVILLAESRRAFDIALAERGINSDDIPGSEAKDSILASKVFELQVESFMGPDNQPDMEAYMEARQVIINQMSPEGQQALEDTKTFFPNHPILAQTETARVQTTKDLDHWFDIPRYRGLTKEQSDEVDQLLDFTSQITEALKMRGVTSYSRDDILQAFGKMSPDLNPTVLGVARVLTHSKIADMVKNPAVDQWALSHPNLAIFYPFIFDSLSEEQQWTWQRTYSGRTGP